jgi:3-deoxy-D-manno-octulosonate 8-phosphate phosphatase (KDO 8-P phosphatase)
MSTAEEKASKIKLFYFDVDGVMTDGRFGITDEGREVKFFNVKDGLGLRMLLSAGIKVVLITGRRSHALEARAMELGIEDLFQGVKEKGGLCRKILGEKGLEKENSACMGDDLPDIAMFRETGLSIAVADAAKEVCEAADFITKNKGGFGAVREACEWVLKCQGKWDRIKVGF